MPFRFACPECQQVLLARSRKIGSEVKCLKCGTPIIVPTKEQAALMRALVRSPPGENEPSGLALYTDDPPAGEKGDHLVEIEAGDRSLLVISRSVLYMQAVLIVVVAALFFVAGYWIGRAGSAIVEEPTDLLMSISFDKKGASLQGAQPG